MVAEESSEFNTDHSHRRLPVPVTQPLSYRSPLRWTLRLKAQLVVVCLVLMAIIHQFQVTLFLAGFWRDHQQQQRSSIPNMSSTYPSKTQLSEQQQQQQQQQKPQEGQMHHPFALPSDSNSGPIPQALPSNQPSRFNVARKPSDTSSALPRIFDVVLFNDELEWLEIRMNELEHVVDMFVIIESAQTFQRQPKPLYFQQQMARSSVFARFMDRVLHIVVPRITDAEYEHNQHIGGEGPWAVESYLRNKGLQMALETHRPSPGDWILHSDVDEIPKASVLAKVKVSPSSLLSKEENDSEGKDNNSSNVMDDSISSLILSCDLFYYSYEFKSKDPWVAPALSRFQLAPANIDLTIDDDVHYNSRGLRVFTKPLWHDWPNAGIRLRWLSGNETIPQIGHACWHCSWCFGNISQVYNKAASYAHSEHNDTKYMNEPWIVQHFRTGVDLFERKGAKYEYVGPLRVSTATDLPTLVAMHPQRYSYLTHRYQAKNAGFLDVPETKVNY